MSALTTPQVRPWTVADIPGIVACHKAAYPEYNHDQSHYDATVFRHQLNAFPEGQLLVALGGCVVAYATSLIVRLDDRGRLPSYDELTSEGEFALHNPDGDTLYGADIAVHPAYRGQGFSQLLYKKRRALLRRFNLRRMIAYGRIPGYARYARRITAGEYVQLVLTGRMMDAALNAHLSAGYVVRAVVHGLLDDDPGHDHCTLLELPNPVYVEA